MVVKCDKCGDECESNAEYGNFYDTINLVGHELHLCINCCNDVYEYIVGEPPVESCE